MVPCWRAGDDALPFFEFSGINGTGDRKWPLKLPFWENLGTDRIKLSRNFRACPGYACRPIISGQRPSVEMFMRDLELGFKQACELFIDNREFLLSKESPLESFRDIAVRCIIRDTNDYGNILFWSYAPDHLVSGDAYSISLEAVFSKEVKFGLSDRPCKSEKLSLTHGDIPVFTGFTDSCSLFIDGKLYTEQTGPADTFSQVIHRIGRLDLKVIQWQIKLINASFQMSFEKEKNKDARTKIKRDFYTKENPDLPISGRLIKEACLIGDALERQAVIFEGAASWIKLVRPFDNSTSVNCAYSDPFLYNGTAGIALFLANLYYASKNKKYFDLAKAALTYSVKAIGKLKEASGFVIPLSAFTGLFGIIYALTETGRLADDPGFFDMALNLACSIEQSDFLEYPDSDIMGGSAGIILVLLHLYNFRPDNKILAMSQALLNSIIKCSEGKLGEKGWNINGFKRPLTGMAHGAAGIAMAVSRFNSIIKSDYKLVHFSAADLESAIKNSITFENSYFCDKEKDWPDLQHLKGREKFFMEGWCSGAPGIGLARLFTETQSSETNKIIQADIIRALKTCTKNMSSTKKHHLCCGESGRIMFLACAGIKADMPEYYEIALKAAINMINFYKIKGFWRFQKVNERMIVHGLMGGVSGIGLTFLKLADQENISNILTLS
jgi:type 2 lantibiotic biosynthesis protein LanM